MKITDMFFLKHAFPEHADIILATCMGFKKVGYFGRMKGACPSLRLVLLDLCTSSIRPERLHTK